MADYALVASPFVLFCCALLTFSSFLSIYFPAWTLLSVIVFSTSLLLLSPGDIFARLSLAAAIAAPLLCLTALFMAVVSVRGPLYFWFLFWTGPSFRLLFFCLGAALLLWLFFALYATARSISAISGGTDLGMLLIAVGTVFISKGLIVRFLGLEECLTVLNNEMTILPLSLSKVLGITTHLNIDPNLPSYVTVFGLVLAVIGWAIRNLQRR